MTKKIFRSILLASASVLLAVLVTVMGYFYGYYHSAREAQMKDGLRLAACGVEEGGRAYLEKLDEADRRYTRTPEYRLTWIAPDGAVLYDAAGDAERMENHADRPEVREALAKGESSGVRYSSTLTQQTLYCARLLSDGTVLRISVGQATVLALALAMLRPVLLVGLLAVVISAVSARWMAGKIVRPLNDLDLDHPLENDAYEELSPLLRRIHQQRRQITAQLQALQKKTDEFSQITGHMREGLVLLDDCGRVLSINPAAQSIFHVDASCSGQGFLQIDHGCDLDAAVRAAAERGHGEVRAERNGREYQFDISQIESDGTVIGTVLLAFDVTERAMAERSRREFTANVSHELKTPLQSITGSAELLENGLVKQEDVPGFIRLIRTEAARLVALVDDIIHLSQLDEGMALAEETVDLSELAVEAASALRCGAEARSIRMEVTGGSACVTGVRGFLYEMLYNLCDNAIKYNVDGGRVEIAVAGGSGGTAVSVRDTGIGIPEEYQSRVFERFFRVDKSRSKASGGTGLGLSIVKHIARYHHASISLYSRTGEGTTISVAF